MPRFLRMPKYRIRTIESSPPTPQSVTAIVTGYSVSILQRPIDASMIQDVTVTSLPQLAVAMDLGTPVTASEGETLGAPTNLRFV